jgi:large subunit ribosomal protein L29
MQKAKEFTKKSREELERELQALRENLSKILFKLAANKLKNVREIRNIKKDIARILTILSQKSRLRPQGDPSFGGQARIKR